MGERYYRFFEGAKLIKSRASQNPEILLRRHRFESLKTHYVVIGSCGERMRGKKESINSQASLSQRLSGSGTRGKQEDLPERINNKSEHGSY